MQVEIYEIGSLPKQLDKQRVTISCTITVLKEVTIKSGHKMGFCTAKDATGTIELVVFADVYATCSELLKLDDLLIITGTLEGCETATIMVEKVAGFS